MRALLPLVALASGATAAEGKRAPGPSVAVQADELSCYERPPFWQRVTDKRVDEYCRLVDRARARLNSSPAISKKLSEEAQRRRSPGVSAKLLHAHAQLLLGHPEEAHREFSRAIPELTAPSAAPFLTPSVVAAGARAALLSQDFASALPRYRWVLLRLRDFRNPREEARLLIEAATAVTYAQKDGGREARAYLSAAEAKNAPLLRPIVQAARALSFLRDGDLERARREAAPFESSWALAWMFEDQNPVGALGETIPVLPPGEHFALWAAVAEAVEPEAAEEHWGEFLEAAGAQLPVHLRGLPGR